MENNITVTFDGEILNIDDNNVDWYAFGCTVGLMTAEDESGESRHDLNNFWKAFGRHWSIMTEITHKSFGLKKNKKDIENHSLSFNSTTSRPLLRIKSV